VSGDRCRGAPGASASAPIAGRWAWKPEEAEENQAASATADAGYRQFVKQAPVKKKERAIFSLGRGVIPATRSHLTS
jgi:hypothetical protein